MECFAKESPSSSSYSASSRAETFRLEGRALFTIFFNFSSEPSSSGRRCGGIGAAAEEVDRAEEGTISDTLAIAYTQVAIAYSEQRGGNPSLGPELILVLEVVDLKSCRSGGISVE
jgi:hypothetical protein